MDGAPSALLRLIPTPGASCLRDSGMDTSAVSRSGMTPRPSTVDRGKDTSTSLAAGFPAKTSRQPARVQASLESDRASGWRWPGSFAKYDRATSSWRTRQTSLLSGGGLDLYSETWPRWGSMRSGESLARTMPALPTSVTAPGSWLATPTATANQASPSMMKHPGCREWRHLGLRVCPAHFEWMMGWPVGWTDLEPLATDKYQRWLRLHGDF